MKYWYCFYHLINNHLECIMSTKKDADDWLEFWHYNPKCYVIEVIE